MCGDGVEMGRSCLELYCKTRSGQPKEVHELGLPACRDRLPNVTLGMTLRIIRDSRQEKTSWRSFSESRPVMSHCPIPAAPVGSTESYAAQHAAVYKTQDSASAELGVDAARCR